MKLFLTSSGIEEGIRQEFLNLLNKDPKDCRVCFIPTAAYPEVNRDHVRKSLSRLREMGDERATIEAVVKTCQYPVVALVDGQAVMIVDEKVKVVGPGERFFFNGFREVV